MLAIFGLLFFWGASLARAEATVRRSPHHVAARSHTDHAKSLLPEACADSLDAPTVSHEQDGPPEQVDGVAQSRRLRARELRTYRGAPLLADRRAATLVGTVVLTL